MWWFESVEFTEVPKDIIGFVYKITNNITGRQYIGKKLFTAAKRTQLRGKRKRTRVESNWRQYYGSNKELLHDVTTCGKEHFHREILYLCKTKGQCSYFEAKEHFQLGVLEYPEKFYNVWIMCRIHRKHLKL